MAKRSLAGGKADLVGALQHMRHHHPGIPVLLAWRIAVDLSSRQWTGLTLGAVVGITMSNFIRHRLTDYERLLRVERMTRDMARKAVAGEVQGILDAWSMGPPPPPRAFPSMRPSASTRGDAATIRVPAHAVTWELRGGVDGTEQETRTGTDCP